MNSEVGSKSDHDADRNWRRFVLFRMLFNSRFYYPVLALLFLDLGLSATQYTLLNFAWALAIVVVDVPAGVLADRIGRKPLIVAASFCMVGEMLLLMLAPYHGGILLFLCCLANRILSGTAEGMASGADEALVFDSLAERNRSDEWPMVLDMVMRWQSAGMVIAMLVGGAAYDPIFMTKVLGVVGLYPHLDQSVTLRFPIYLNLLTAMAALAVVAGFREPSVREPQPGATPAPSEDTLTAGQRIISAGSWLTGKPVALFVIVGGLLLDSVGRLFYTFSSTYFRLIELPEASYGIIGAGLGALGMVVSPIARRMVATNTLLLNYLLITGVTLVSLICIAFRWKFWGVVFMVPFGAAMTALGFMVSYYLNALVESHRRATLLSFKGVAFNLAYGFVSLLFAVVLRAFRDGGRPEIALERGLCFLPLWLILTLVVAVIAFRRHLSALQTRY